MQHLSYVKFVGIYNFRYFIHHEMSVGGEVGRSLRYCNTRPTRDGPEASF